MNKPKIVRTATVAISLDNLLKGQLAFLNNHFEVVAISGKDAHLKNVEAREKVKTIPLTFKRKISLIHDIVSLVKLYFILRKQKPLIVHSITPKAGLLSMTAAYFARVPIRIHTFTGLIFPYKQGIFQKVLLTMDKMLCQFATHIIPEGNGVKDHLLQYKVTKKPLQIIANGNVNGIDTQYFSIDATNQLEIKNIRKNMQLQENDFVFLYVGRIVKDKGINELVEAFKRLNEEHKYCKLLLVGSSEKDDPILPETSHTIKTNINIIEAGFQDELRPYYALSDVFVFPSYREGFPNVVLQAGAMQLPVIATNISGSNEIIMHNKNGWIIPIKDSNMLYQTMKFVVENKNEYQSFKKSAREHVVQNFEQHYVWEEQLKFYNNTIKNV